MPYSSGDDPSLPGNVKKLPARKRRQWVAVFNGVMERGGSEGSAFAQANGVVKEMTELATVKCLCGEVSAELAVGTKEYRCAACQSTMNITWGQRELSTGEKCDTPMAVEYEPFGGATSFADYDAWREGLMIDQNVEKAKDIFDGIYHNIWADDELSAAEKIAATKAASDDMVARMQEPPAMGFRDKVKGFLGLGAEKAMTKHEAGADFSASDYADVPDAQKPSTWKLRLGSTPGTVDATHVGGAITALQPSGFRGNRVQLGSSKAQVVGKISAAIGKLSSADDKKRLRERLAAVKELTSTFLVTKDASTGEYRWLAIFSNKFRDRDGEIFSEAAHKEYQAWVEQTGSYPVARLWHTPGADFGRADFITYADGFQIAAGVFNKGFEDVAASLAKAEGLGVSHGFIYDANDLVDDVYGRYRTFELGPLPMEKAANAWTAFTIQQLREEKAMTLTAEKRGFLVQHFGEARTAQLEQALPELSKALEEQGIGWKELGLALTEGEGSPSGGASDPSPGAAGTDAGGAGQPAATKPLVEDPADEAPAPVAQEDKALKAIGEAVTKALEPVTARLVALEADMTALRASDDEKIAAALGPRASAPSSAQRPSERTDNLLSKEQAAKLESQEKDKPEEGNNGYTRALLADLVGFGGTR